MGEKKTLSVTSTNAYDQYRHNVSRKANNDKSFVNRRKN